MGFQGIGFWEILLVLIVALVVLGPARVPEVARKLGQTIRSIRKASSDLTAAVSRELDASKPEKTPAPARPAAAKTPPAAEKTAPAPDKSGDDEGTSATG